MQEEKKSDYFHFGALLRRGNLSLAKDYNNNGKPLCS